MLHPLYTNSATTPLASSCAQLRITINETVVHDPGDCPCHIQLNVTSESKLKLLNHYLMKTTH